MHEWCLVPRHCTEISWPSGEINHFATTAKTKRGSVDGVEEFVASHGELLYQLHVAEAGLPGSIQEKTRTSVCPEMKYWVCRRSMTVKYNNDMSWCHETWL